MTMGSFFIELTTTRKTSILSLMKLVLALSTFLITELGILQAQMIPSELSSVLIQLPVVALFAWYVLHSNKQNREWLDHLLANQDTRHKVTIDLFEKILERMDIRQNQMADRVEILTQQLAVNTSTVNEAMRLTELADELKKLVKQRV